MRFFFAAFGNFVVLDVQLFVGTEYVADTADQ
jgi:hypothetical protein